MSIFDEVTFEYPLPDPEWQNEIFQTKGLRGAGDKLSLKLDGKLYLTHVLDVGLDGEIYSRKLLDAWPVYLETLFVLASKNRKFIRYRCDLIDGVLDKIVKVGW